jgi:hypothetical protein
LIVEDHEMSMQRVITAGLAAMAVGIWAGCDSRPQTSNPGTPAPHGGELILMPGGQGYLEVVRKPAAAAGGTISQEVSFYVLDQDSRPRTPSSGVLVLGKKRINLALNGDGLSTPDGPPLFAKGDLDGVLETEIEGKKLSIPLGVRQ